MENRKVVEVPTKPYEGQKPGTSGLRKKVKVFQQDHYLANFVQATFNSIPKNEVEGCTYALGGDGRYFSKEAVHIIAEIAAGNGVKKLLIGQDTLVCTPAMSCVIRDREGGMIRGGFLLTASHNPGGPEEDFGVKFNCFNGGPAPESLTGKIFEETTTINSYKKVVLPKFDLSTAHTETFEGDFTVEVFDSVEDYVTLLKGIFDFEQLKALCARESFSMTYDAMHGVAGPYAEALFCRELGVSTASMQRCTPKEDFGGCHPDPNLVYAKELVDIMFNGPTSPVFGAAGDGDADRNMILGRDFFVNPSDSVAIIAHYARDAIPWFKDRLSGCARSMPTSCALDRVAKKLGLECFETPTGWKFFGNLMDSNKIQLCGEESFGTGGSHVREKDGLWTVLCWLSILAYRNADTSKPFVTVEQIVTEFWAEYGRCFYSRYDYEGVCTEGANKLIERLLSYTPESASTKFSLNDNPIDTIDNFRYVDPVDSSVSEKQGVRYIFKDGSRLIWRLSGTGSSGATVRMYIEQYCNDPARISQDPPAVLKFLIDFGIQISNIKEFCSVESPTVIT